MAAAWALTRDPAWQSHSEITVYQQGWRLGGKGASGRNLDPTFGSRIEEHGLHLWGGFYDNAFRLMRECYSELNGDWTQAFKPVNRISLQEHLAGKWLSWPITLPSNGSQPGEGRGPTAPWRLVARTTDWLHGEVHRKSISPDIPGAATLFAEAKSISHQVAQLINAMPFEPEQHAGGDAERAAVLLERLRTALKRSSVSAAGLGDTVRRFFLLADIAATVSIGMIRDGVPLWGFDSIDHWEIGEWLQRHGIGADALASPVVRGSYDYVFGYVDGDIARPAQAAGVALRGMFRVVFDYSGSIFWKMTAGMGDVVFAPLYQALKQRGVRFEFFSRVTSIEPDANLPQIRRIRLDRQATLKRAAYDPLIDVRGRPSWPNQPLFDQLVEGTVLGSDWPANDLESDWSVWRGQPQTLELDRDFDVVVLGISLGGLPAICSEFPPVNPAWGTLFNNVKTVPTLALQLWFNRTSSTLKWSPGAIVTTGYEQRHDTCADLSHLLAAEDWRTQPPPLAIAYLCGPLDDRAPNGAGDPDFPILEAARARDLAERWLDKNGLYLWPAANAAGKFDYGVLYDPSGGTGARRLDAQYWRANVNPTDRYVLHLPGTTVARLKADQSGFGNLFLAGDWVRTGINAGCVEAAVMSGLQAARAIQGGGGHISGESDR